MLNTYHHQPLLPSLQQLALRTQTLLLKLSFEIHRRLKCLTSLFRKWCVPNLYSSHSTLSTHANWLSFQCFVGEIFCGHLWVQKIPNPRWMVLWWVFKVWHKTQSDQWCCFLCEQLLHRQKMHCPTQVWSFFSFAQTQVWSFEINFINHISLHQC